MEKILQNNLGLIREYLGWSRAELANKMGCSRQQILNEALDDKISSEDYEYIKEYYLKKIAKKEIIFDQEAYMGCGVNPWPYIFVDEKGVRNGGERCYSVHR